MSDKATFLSTNRKGFVRSGGPMLVGWNGLREWDCSGAHLVQYTFVWYRRIVADIIVLSDHQSG